MYYILLIISLLITSCNVKVKSEPVKADVVQSGESYTYVVLRLEFIQQIKDLCIESNVRPNGIDDVTYNKIVADCTLNNLHLFQISTPKSLDFVGKYCSPDSDLSGLNPQELVNIKAACSMLAP